MPTCGVKPPNGSFSCCLSSRLKVSSCVVTSTNQHPSGFQAEVPTYPTEHPAEAIDYMVFRNVGPAELRPITNAASDHLPIVSELSFAAADNQQ